MGTQPNRILGSFRILFSASDLTFTMSKLPFPWVRWPHKIWKKNTQQDTCNYVYTKIFQRYLMWWSIFKENIKGKKKKNATQKSNFATFFRFCDVCVQVEVILKFLLSALVKWIKIFTVQDFNAFEIWRSFSSSQWKCSLSCRVSQLLCFCKNLFSFPA